MARGNIPMIVFDGAEDISLWSQSANITVTGGQTDPFGGTDAYRIQDTAVGGSSESAVDTLGVLTPNVDDEVIVALFLKEDTDSDHVDVNLHDNGVSANRHIVRVNFSGGVPTVTSETGSGTVFAPIDCGNGWWLIRFSAAAIVAGNIHSLFIYPAGTGAGVGDVFAYGRAVIVFGLPLDNARAWPRPRPGSEWAAVPSGEEDAWITGDDEVLAGAARWIPGLDTDAPLNATGWDGRREHTMVNVGWDTFLRFGGDKTTFRFAPDRADCSANRVVFMTDPEDSRKAALEGDASRRVELLLRDSNDFPFEGY